jgi:transposase
MRRPLQLTNVHWRQKARSSRLYQDATCPRFRIRLQMVLLSIAGHTLGEIATIVRESDETVRRWLHRFMTEGCDGLTERERAGRPTKLTPEVDCFVLACIEKSPREAGFDRAMWTTKLMAKAVERQYGLKVSNECVRQHLAKNEVVCRRPTWSVKHLAQKEPGYAQKKLRSQGF